MGRDGPALQRFYASLFGWEIDADNPMGYGVVKHSENHSTEGVGIGGGILGGMEQGQDNACFYVEVPDVEATWLKQSGWAAPGSWAPARSREAGWCSATCSTPRATTSASSRQALPTPPPRSTRRPAAGAPRWSTSRSSAGTTSGWSASTPPSSAGGQT